MIERIFLWLESHGIAQPDKAAHWVGGALLGVACVLTVGVAWALVLGVALSWGKERYDKAHPTRHTWDGWDAYATLLGTVTACVGVALYDSATTGVVAALFGWTTS